MSDPAPAARDATRPDAAPRAWLAQIHVTLKPVVNDPQGLAVMGGLHQLGYASVASVRLGKYVEVQLAAPDEPTAASQVDAMCRRLLANPVIEDYRFVLAEAAEPSPDA
jgi:phosphoribosylformylglycinamidine synthase